MPFEILRWLEKQGLAALVARQKWLAMPAGRRLIRPKEITFADDSGLLESRTNRRGALLLSLEAETYPDFQLGDIFVSSDTIVDLFQHFERYYLVHAPFMQPVGSLDRLASASPLLFWTIALITCQHHEKHHELYSRLLAPHQELMVPLSTRAIRSIGEVHALLLLCMWPLPKRQALLDPTWSYVGIAVNTCMKMNFHNPLPPGHAAQGFGLWSGSPGDITPQSQSLTWMAMFQGVLPPLASSHHLRYVRKALEHLGSLVPTEFQASIFMYEIVCKYSVSLEEVDDIAVQFSFIQAFDSSLDAIKQTYRAQWTPELDIQLQCSKLNLYAMTALLPPREAAEMEVQDRVNIQSILHRGLESSSRIISQMKELSLLPFENGLSNGGRLTSYPRLYSADMFFAATYLFRSLLDRRLLSPTHVARAVESLVEARKLFTQMPRHRDGAMAGEILEKIVDKARSAGIGSGLLSSTQLCITNRLGASLMHDTLFHIHQAARQKPYLTSTPADQVQAAGVHPPLPDTITPTADVQFQAVDIQSIPLNTSLGEDPGEGFWPWLDASINDMVADLDQQIFM
ncbi:hypothetical protein DL767_005703 [Monosporascus sp. MG133]|nr:hypothetical protein DL767_005703 [Monosporascus sp. MG133]